LDAQGVVTVIATQLKAGSVASFSALFITRRRTASRAGCFEQWTLVTIVI
jgi:hypothetical protein